MSAPKTVFRVAPPAGAVAYFFDEAEKRRNAEASIVAALGSRGYREAILPIIDYLAPYAGLLDRRAERGLYRFVDRQGEALSLRGDFTTALARHLAPRLAGKTEPVRVFYRGEVVRAGGGDGDARDFYQVGAELLGGTPPEADLEILGLCCDAIQSASDSELFVSLSFAGAVEALLADVPEIVPLVRSRKLDEASRLAAGRSSELLRRVRYLVRGDLSSENLPAPLARAGPTLLEAKQMLEKAGVRAAIDPAESPGHFYYTGMFFRVYGARGGAPLAAGGRYDTLYGAFGEARPAVGFTASLEGIIGR